MLAWYVLLSFAKATTQNDQILHFLAGDHIGPHQLGIINISFQS